VDNDRVLKRLERVTNLDRRSLGHGPKRVQAPSVTRPGGAQRSDLANVLNEHVVVRDRKEVPRSPADVLEEFLGRKRMRPRRLTARRMSQRSLREFPGPSSSGLSALRCSSFPILTTAAAASTRTSIGCVDSRAIRVSSGMRIEHRCTPRCPRRIPAVPWALHHPVARDEAARRCLVNEFLELRSAMISMRANFWSRFRRRSSPTTRARSSARLDDDVGNEEELGSCSAT